MAPLAVVTIADNNYVLGLVVTVRSMLEHLPRDTPVELYVLGEMSEEHQERLLRSWDHPALEVHFETIDPSQVDGLPRVELFLSTVVPFYRLLVSDIVAPEHERVVWLDSDLLVRRDVTELVEHPALADHVMVAARDIGMPNVRNGVLRWETLGMEPDAPYINVGVMAVDMVKWRADDPAPAMFAYLRQYVDEIVFLDQDALNVHFSGKVGMLDPRWNVIHNAWEPQGAMSLGDQLIETVRADPWVVHYTSWNKPWRRECEHPYKAQWFEVLDRTDWAGWRPPPPPPPPPFAKRVRKGLERRAVLAGDLAKDLVRDVRARVGGPADQPTDGAG
jgi:lipopolysaccharide biosynthesis glycosyltransferase